ncbi:MAG: hypothetical protein ABFR75_11010 [Acidobacteriota bacterium]
MILVWSKFLLLLFLIYIFGNKVTKNADMIAEKKGWGRAFMGVVFISMITSFPELFTGISAASIVHSPDIAIGEIVGSCIFNLLIIGIIELLFRRNKLFENKSKKDYLPILFSLILISLLSAAILIKLKFSLLNIGFSSLLIIVFYVFFMKIIFNNRKAEKINSNYKGMSMKKAIIAFSLSSLVIIMIGIYLPIVGKELAFRMGWTDSFVGVVFLAFVTSFPELIVSFAAARIGAFDMLLGNIAGSNLFNIAIIFIIDIFYIRGDILLNISDQKIFYIGLIAATMNIVILSRLMQKKFRKFFSKIPVTAVILVLLYLISLLIIY